MERLRKPVESNLEKLLKTVGKYLKSGESPRCPFYSDGCTIQRGYSPKSEDDCLLSLTSQVDSEYIWYVGPNCGVLFRYNSKTDEIEAKGISIDRKLREL